MKTLVLAPASLALALVATASAQTVYSNNGGFGDAYTNAGGSNQGQAITGSNWYYNNVRNSGTVGINTTYARNGNGSAYMNGVFGPGGASSKADIEFFGSAVGGGGNFGPASAIGTLGSLNALRFDWYRDSSSTAEQWLHPVIRLGVIDLNTFASGYLVFEREVNNPDFGGPSAAVPVDQWVTDDVFSGDYRLWSSGSTLPYNLNGTNGPVKYYDALRLSEWQANFGHYLVTSVCLGIGSGWGSFTGAVDNVAFGFDGGQSYDFNFEVVPAPGALAVLGLGGILGGRRRRA
jgi:hypothetical protein